LVCVGIALKVGVASLIIIGHGGERGFVREFKGGRGVAGMGEAVDFSFGRFAWVVIRLRRGRGRWDG
jgi:hypothetical protein